jgi:hypothetical protein
LEKQVDLFARRRKIADLSAADMKHAPCWAARWRHERHVMPGIINRLAAPETAPMLGDEVAILADHNPVGVSVPSTGRPRALALTEYLLLSKRTRQVFETAAGTAWNPSNRPA